MNEPTNSTTEDKKDNSTKARRRDVLKYGLTSVTTSGLIVSSIDVGTAAQTEMSLGETHLIETVLQYDVPEGEPLGNACGRRNYSLNRHRGLMGLLDPTTTDIFEQKTVVLSDRHGFHDRTTELYGNTTTHILVFGDYHGGTERALYLEEEYQQPTIETISVSDGEIECRITDGYRLSSLDRESPASKEVSISSESDTSITLPKREVTVTENNVYLGMNDKPDVKYKQIEVTPQIKIRNNGLIRVFGRKGYHVLPANPSDPWVERFRGMYPELTTETQAGATGDQLFVIRKGDNQ